MPLPRPGSIGSIFLYTVEVIGPASQEHIFKFVTESYGRQRTRMPSADHVRRIWNDLIEAGHIIKIAEDLWERPTEPEPTPPVRSLPGVKIPYQYEDLPDDYLALHDAGLYGPQPAICTHVPRSSHAEFLSTERTRKPAHIGRGAN